MSVVKCIKAVTQLLVFSTLSIAVTAAETHTVNINGYDYTLSLESHSRLGANHYLGSVVGESQSWVRMSKLAGRWHGLISMQGEKFRISVPAPSSASAPGPTAASVSTLRAESVDSFSQMPGAACAASSASTAQKVSINSVKASALSLPAAEKVQVSTLCAKTVNGECLLAELELAFDKKFQDALGAQAQSTATSIINVVEGIYLNDLEVSFDVLTTEFLTGETFSTTTDASDFLNDIQDKKATLAFVKNQRSLFHVITGRDFDDGTAGIAFTGELCGTSGFATGTSQVLTANGDSVSLTSLVVAHELGHNFGASHDGDAISNNSCGTGFIMEPTVSSANSNFSSCSISEIHTKIAGLSSADLSQCFNFPLAMSIVGNANNVSSANAGATFDAEFDVSIATASLAVSTLTLNGQVDTANGRFESVTFNGAACTVADGGATYSCTASNPAASSKLNVTGVGVQGDAQFSHDISVSNANLHEDDTSDNNLVVNVNVVGVAPTPTPTPTPSSSGGGGGHSGIALLLMLLMGFGLRGVRNA